jgi:hypothetical protein
MPEYRCFKCEKEWISRKEYSERCPRCHSVEIEITSEDVFIEKTCIKCHKSWMPRVENPQLCPFCKTSYWEKQ